MSNKIYPISPAKIGDQDGFRLPRAFSREHPQLVNACGEDENDEESLVMGLFLDFLMKMAISEPETLAPYTEAMSTEVDQLLAGVIEAEQAYKLGDYITLEDYEAARP